MADLSPARCSAQAFRVLNTVVEPVVRRGWLAPGPLGAGLVALGATGRRSGRRSFRPLVTLRAGSRMVVGTVRPRSDWVANLSEDPAPVVIGRHGPSTVEADLHRLVPFGTIAVLRPAPERERIPAGSVA